MTPISVPDVVVRSLRDGESDLFDALGGPSLGPPGRTYAGEAAKGHYRPDWTWVAVRGDALVARAAWWGAPDAEHPIALDWFDLGPGDHPDPEKVAIGAQLLRAANQVVHAADGRPCEYHLFLPADWRDRPDVKAAAEDRMAAAAGAGLRRFVERLRIEYVPPGAATTGAAAPGAGAPGAERAVLDGDGDNGRGGDGEASLTETADGRLRLSPADDDAELLAVLERICDGALDAYTARDVEHEGVAAAARTQLDDLGWMPAPRAWWRLARDAEGELVGFVAPTKNYDSAVIGYVGVVPEQRGRGYAGALVTAATAFLVAHGAPVVKADTDTGNRPMAAAFARAGYEVTARRVVMTPRDEG